MFNALRFKILTALLALPLAGCDSTTFRAFVPEASVAAAFAPNAEIGAGADAAATLKRAKSLLNAGNFGLAADAYRKAVEARPDDAQRWLGLAAAYDELGRFDLADRAYRRALQLGGATVQLLNNRGYSHLLRGDYAAARRDLAAARSKDPNNAQIEKNLALLQQRVKGI